MTSTMSLTMTPVDLHPVLKAAACRYAAMSPSDFVNDTLTVTSTKLRELGMIDTETWARVPAGGAVRVVRDAGDALRAHVLLPWQREADGPGLSVKHAYAWGRYARKCLGESNKNDAQ